MKHQDIKVGDLFREFGDEEEGRMLCKEVVKLSDKYIWFEEYNFSEIKRRSRKSLQSDLDSGRIKKVNEALRIRIGTGSSKYDFKMDVANVREARAVLHALELYNLYLNQLFNKSVIELYTNGRWEEYVEVKKEACGPNDLEFKY